MYNGIDHPLLNAAYEKWDAEMSKIERQYKDNASKYPIGCRTEILMERWLDRYNRYWDKKMAATNDYLAEVDRILADGSKVK